MINKMNLSIESELATANMDIVAQRDSRAALRTTLATPAVDLFPLAFYNVTTVLNTVDISRFVKSWGWEFDNGISVEEGQGLGSRFPYIFRTGDGECGLTIKREDETSAILDEFWASAAGPSNVTHTPFVTESTFDSGAFGNMVVRFPRCYYKTISTTISGTELRVPDLSIGTEAAEVTLAGTGAPTVVTPVVITVRNNRPAYNV
ncbi:MAG: hypothetical protein DDT29_01583 [Dehalococcoidia bacterium]|nr:hypothetical protein [Bacillota bacterium]